MNKPDVAAQIQERYFRVIEVMTGVQKEIFVSGRDSRYAWQNKRLRSEHLLPCAYREAPVTRPLFSWTINESQPANAGSRTRKCEDLGSLALVLTAGGYTGNGTVVLTEERFCVIWAIKTQEADRKGKQDKQRRLPGAFVEKCSPKCQVQEFSTYSWRR